MFSGTTFGVAGHFTHRPLSSLREIIHTHKGTFIDNVASTNVHIVLSTAEMASILENPYKLQFFPTLRDQVNICVTYNIPIVEDKYLDDCVTQRQKLPVEDYIIKAFYVDVEGKFQVKKDVPSSLDPRVQDLVKLLFDQKEIDSSLVDMGMDVRRINDVTQDSIKQAFILLNQLESKVTPDPNLTQEQHENNLRILSDQFYDIIPHRGERALIKTIDTIKDKAKLLESLTDIEIALRLMREKGEDDLNMNPIDVNYRKLRCEITPLERYRSEYALIEEMVKQTQSKDFKFQIEIDSVYEVSRHGELERFSKFKKLPHHRLLWHGSRVSNYIGILSQGLRIAPPEAPVTGYFLGKGIYLGDMVSVSSQYCRATKEKPYGILLVCEAALGRTYQIAHGKSISKEDIDEAGFHSVKCWGTKGPNSGYDTQTNEGVFVSLGKEAPTGVPVSEIVHNEIVVYDEAQVTIKYLVKVNFTF